MAYPPRRTGLRLLVPAMNPFPRVKKRCQAGARIVGVHGCNALAGAFENRERLAQRPRVPSFGRSGSVGREPSWRRGREGFLADTYLSSGRDHVADRGAASSRERAGTARSII